MNNNPRNDYEDHIDMIPNYIPYEPEDDGEEEEVETEIVQAEAPVTCSIWVKCFSEEHNYYYYYNNNTQETQWECPDESKIYIVYEGETTTKGDGSWQEQKGDENENFFNQSESEPYYDNLNEYYSEVNQPEEASQEVDRETITPAVFHFQDIPSSDERMFSKPLQKGGKTIFADSPLSNLSTVLDHESVHSAPYGRDSLVSSHFDDDLEEKADHYYHRHNDEGIDRERDRDSRRAQDKGQGPGQGPHSFYVSPPKTSLGRMDDGDETESDSSDYFVVSEVNTSPVKRPSAAAAGPGSGSGSGPGSGGNSASRARVPPLAIRTDVPMISREEFMSSLEDSYSINLRDLALGSEDSQDSQTAQQKRLGPPRRQSPHILAQIGPPSVNKQRLSVKDNNSSNSNSSTGNVTASASAPAPAGETKKSKKSSTTKKVLKFVNAFVGNSKPKPTGSEFSQTLKRIEQESDRHRPPPLSQPQEGSGSSSSSSNGGATPLTDRDDSHLQSGGSAEVFFDEVYPQCSDEYQQSKSIYGVNMSSGRRGSAASSSSINIIPPPETDGSLSAVNSGRTTLDSDRSAALPHPYSHPNLLVQSSMVVSKSRSEDSGSRSTARLSAVEIDWSDKISRSKSRSSQSSELHCSSGDSVRTSTANSSGSNSEASSPLGPTDVEAFLRNMASLGFDETECMRALDRCDNHIMRATAVLLEETDQMDKNDPSLDRFAAAHEEVKSKRTKLKKSLFKFLPIDF